MSWLWKERTTFLLLPLLLLLLLLVLLGLLKLLLIQYVYLGVVV